FGSVQGHGGPVEAENGATKAAPYVQTPALQTTPSRISTPTKGVVAITNARIFPITRPMIDRGTIVIRDGLIESVSAGGSAPPGAQVIDAAGAEVYPGFINARSTIGLADP